MGVKNQEKVYSVTDVLGITINRLASIQIPIVALDTIGVPIQDAIRNLESCMQVLASAKQPNTDSHAENPEEEEMEISIETEPMPEENEPA